MYRSGKGDEELGAELPACGRVSPHGCVGSGKENVAVGQTPDPVAVLAGQRQRGREIDGVGDALVTERDGLGKGVGEGFKVGGASEQGAVADDDDEVVGERGGEGGEIAGGDGKV